MNVYILDNFVPDDHTLKYKSSIDKLIISSHGKEDLLKSTKHCTG